MEESTDELLYSLSKVKLPQWLGLKVSVYMCLRYNYVLSLIHAAPHVTSGLEVNIQGVLCNTQWRSIQKPEEDRDAGEEHSLRYETPEFSIISSHQSEQSGLHRLSSHPPTVSTPPVGLSDKPALPASQNVYQHAGIGLGHVELRKKLELL